MFTMMTSDGRWTRKASRLAAIRIAGRVLSVSPLGTTASIRKGDVEVWKGRTGYVTGS